MQRNKHAILFVPDWRQGNPYLELLAAGVEAAGCRVQFADYPPGFFKLSRLAARHPRIGVLHLHWVRQLFDEMLWAGSRWKFWAKLALFSLDCLLCRWRGVRIVWTIHNLVEHESPSPEREKTARKRLFKMADAVILHSREALAAVASAYGVADVGKATIIPHGNYIGMYEEDPRQTQSLRERLTLTGKETVLLFFGSVRPYKGLEALVPVFSALEDDSYRLIVAGRNGDQGLVDWLQAQAAQDARILPTINFIPDEEVASYFALADAVILPFERTLTSGSVLLAMSLGKCILLPKEARVLGLPGDQGALYYEGADGLASALRDLRHHAPEVMGAFNREYAERLDWSAIGASTAEAYEGRISAGAG